MLMSTKWHRKEIDLTSRKWIDRLPNRYDHIRSLSFKPKPTVSVVWGVSWPFRNVKVPVDGPIQISSTEESKINKLLTFYVDVYLYEHG